jgi:hypothetical protein
VLLEHRGLHCPLLESHWKAPHEVEDPAWHFPLPSQVGADIFDNGGGGVAQLGLPHATPTAVCWQLPLPSQLPVLPHGGLAAQVVVPARGDEFAGMLLHVPFFDCTTQL